MEATNTRELDPIGEMGKFFRVKQRKCNARQKKTETAARKRARKSVIRTVKAMLGRRLTAAECVQHLEAVR